VEEMEQERERNAEELSVLRYVSAWDV